VLRPVQETFNPDDFQALLVGLTSPDDAAVYRLNDQQAIISTTDFFPPVVDDPYAYGAIAAANAMSDVYAMGGEVLFAINLAAFPENLSDSFLAEILRGGAEKVREAGAVIAGGHTITDEEPKYGLAVTGLVHPERILTKGGAQVGDTLVLTKPLGAGVVTTALRGSVADPGDVQVAVESMSRLNKTASEIVAAIGVHAATDVTGFGLLGHGHEMAHLSGAALRLEMAALPWLPGARRYGEASMFPGGMSNNKLFYEKWITFAEGVTETEQLLLFDPETSGGLLVAVALDKIDALIAEMEKHGEPVWRIGEVIEGNGQIEVV
jgi:selenide,water dikinase